jgi:hypothetical protein
MAQQSGFHSTSATPTGHQVANYSEALMALANGILSACHGSAGVAPSYLNALAPTAGGANTVNVATGAAIVNGYWYLNDAVQAVNIPSSGGGTIRYDRVVLRHTGSPTFTVVLTVLTGSAIMPPAKGANDVDICTVLVTDAGAVTVTDAREYARIQTAGIADLGVTTPKLAANALSADAAGRAKMQDGFINTDKMGAAAVTYSRIQDVGACGVPARAANTAGVLATVQAAANNRVLMRKADVLTFAQIEADQIAALAIIAGKIANGGVDTTDRLANDIVDDTKVGNRVPQLRRRQGGSATDWSVQGSSNYTPTAVWMQPGVSRVTINTPDSFGFVDITFPVAFSGEPMVLGSIRNVSGEIQGDWYFSNHTASTMRITVVRAGISGTSIYDITWLAIGSE